MASESNLRRRARPSLLITLWSMLVLAAGCGRAGNDVENQTPRSSNAGVQSAVQTPESAQAVIARAVAEAAGSKKIVLIEFGASWCKWCTNFQNFVHSKDAGPVMADNYVVTNLVVLEEGKKKALENAGAEELMTEWADGRQPGLPFYVFLDAEGRKIADSMAMPGGKNIGFPYSQEEVGVFMGLIDRTAPRLDSTGRAVILASLRSTGEPASN